ncbi:MAG TPA: rhomboid family intramembrane serine protease [Candidatus Didemnitutus sp.]
MSEGYSRQRTSVHVWLVAGIVSAFIMELVLMSPWWPAGQRVISDLVLSIPSLHSGFVWTLLTHGLIHDNNNPFHILFVALMILYLGRDLTPVLGTRRLLVVFAAALVAGGLAWTGVHWFSGGMYYGASAAALGLFVVFAGVFPDHTIGIFFIPTSFRARHFVWALAALEVFGLLLYEVRGAASPFSLSPSAHLGGMLAGWAYVRFFHARDGWDRADRSLFRLPSWLRRHRIETDAPRFQIKQDERAGLRSEVDRILDKINSHGFGSLTAEEKRLLDEAKDLLSRH